MLTVELKEWGNSYAIRISKKEAKALGIEKGDMVVVDVKENKPRTIKEMFGCCKGSKPFVRDRDDRF